MSKTVHQYKTTSLSSQTTSTALTFDSTTTTGRSILVLIAGGHVSGYDVTTPDAVTDNKSNTYVEIADTGLYGSSRNRLMAFVCHNATGGASHQVTVNHLRTTNNGVAIALIEFSSTSAIGTDKVGTNFDDTSPVTTTATASGANTDANALVFGFAAWPNAAAQITGTLDGDFTSLFTSMSAVDYRLNGHCGYYVASGTETSAFTATVASTDTVLGALVLTFSDDGQKYVKLLAHSSAASATGVEGVVLSAARDTVIGEFTGQAFEASLESGEAVLLIPVDDITPDGSALTTTDTPLVSAYNSTYGTVGLGSATVIEV